jgi:hypothetical protein
MLRTGTNEFIVAVTLIALSGILFYQGILNGM